MKQQGQKTEQPMKAKAMNTRTKRILSKLQEQLSEPEPVAQEVFQALEKLDLQCYPTGKVPDWLKPQNMKNLKKLYIRGGKLHNPGETTDDDQWPVEIMRLKFLDELEINWDTLQASFPNLRYLEKFECKKLTSFPCNPKGVWVKGSNEHNSSQN